VTVIGGLRTEHGPLGLSEAARQLLRARLDRAIKLARRQRRPILASVRVPADAAIDASATVLAARTPSDSAFCFEQPDRDRFAIAALGSAAVVEASGERRFESVAEQCRDLTCGAIADGADPVWVGGFAFAPDGAATPEWSSFGPARLTLPEVAITRRGDRAELTVNAVVTGDEAPDAVLERCADRTETLVPVHMPLVDPHPVERARVVSAAPPEHFAEAVRRATERIAAGELEKIVLAREVRVHAPRPIDAAAVYGGLRDRFPSCYCYLAVTPDAAFVGATPELLVRRDGQRAQTVALAGTLRRSADPALDRHLAEQLLGSERYREEQAIVTRRIERTLGPVSVWVAAAEEPVVVKVQNVQHLGTPIRAQLAEPLACAELAGRLHPTPAVGGEPEERALPLIPALEGLDRGWYAAPLGWTDLAEDGEFCVALRCALIRDRVAHLYAGEGIVRESVPDEELAANEAKLQALLPLLT
jgi:salicylate biosynthesis isochorismate synthase/menaquinone-specific isochorismate synthase